MKQNALLFVYFLNVSNWPVHCWQWIIKLNHYCCSRSPFFLLIYSHLFYKTDVHRLYTYNTFLLNGILIHYIMNFGSVNAVCFAVNFVWCKYRCADCSCKLCACHCQCVPWWSVLLVRGLKTDFLVCVALCSWFCLFTLFEVSEKKIQFLCWTMQFSLFHHCCFPPYQITFHVFQHKPLTFKFLACCRVLCAASTIFCIATECISKQWKAMCDSPSISPTFLLCFLKFHPPINFFQPSYPDSAPLKTNPNSSYYNEWKWFGMEWRTHTSVLENTLVMNR